MQSLDTALENVPKDKNGKISKEFLQLVLDAVAPAADLPPVGSVEQVSYSDCCFQSLWTVILLTVLTVNEHDYTLFPPLILQIDKVVAESFKMLNVDDGKTVKEDEFKKILTEILGSIMLQLEGNPVSVSSNSVVHEPLSSSSSVLQSSS